MTQPEMLSSFADTYDCEKLRILQSMNDQIEVMAIKLDQIVTHIEEVIKTYHSFS